MTVNRDVTGNGSSSSPTSRHDLEDMSIDDSDKDHNAPGAPTITSSFKCPDCPKTIKCRALAVVIGNDGKLTCYGWDGKSRGRPDGRINPCEQSKHLVECPKFNHRITEQIGDKKKEQFVAAKKRHEKDFCQYVCGYHEGSHGWTTRQRAKQGATKCRSKCAGRTNTHNVATTSSAPPTTSSVAFGVESLAPIFTRSPAVIPAEMNFNEHLLDALLNFSSEDNSINTETYFGTLNDVQNMSPGPAWQSGLVSIPGWNSSPEAPEISNTALEPSTTGALPRTTQFSPQFNAVVPSWALVKELKTVTVKLIFDVIASAQVIASVQIFFGGHEANIQQMGYSTSSGEFQIEATPKPRDLPGYDNIYILLSLMDGSPTHCIVKERAFEWIPAANAQTFVELPIRRIGDLEALCDSQQKRIKQLEDDNHSLMEENLSLNEKLWFNLCNRRKITQYFSVILILSSQMFIIPSTKMGRIIQFLDGDTFFTSPIIFLRLTYLGLRKVPVYNSKLERSNFLRRGTRFIVDMQSFRFYSPEEIPRDVQIVKACGSNHRAGFLLGVSFFHGRTGVLKRGYIHQDAVLNNSDIKRVLFRIWLSVMNRMAESKYGECEADAGNHSIALDAKAASDGHAPQLSCEHETESETTVDQQSAQLSSKSKSAVSPNLDVYSETELDQNPDIQENETDATLVDVAEPKPVALHLGESDPRLNFVIYNNLHLIKGCSEGEIDAKSISIPIQTIHLASEPFAPSITTPAPQSRIYTFFKDGSYAYKNGDIHIHVSARGRETMRLRITSAQTRGLVESRSHRFEDASRPKHPLLLNNNTRIRTSTGGARNIAAQGINSLLRIQLCFKGNHWTRFTDGSVCYNNRDGTVHWHMTKSPPPPVTARATVAAAGTTSVRQGVSKHES
ncbi:hypothetical protein M427DRAFT_150364, partial [Gonapodya prolifera JEL478]